MVSVDTFRVKVRVARVLGLIPAGPESVQERLKGVGEGWVRYGPGRIHSGDLKTEIGRALRLDPSFFEVNVENDDGTALSGSVVHRDSQAVIGRWGTLAPHRFRFDSKGKKL